MQYRALGKTGLQLSQIGFGASPFGNVFGDVGFRECQQAVDAAIAGGVNFFDVSPYYGLTLAETRLGETLRGKRHSIYLATKCGRYGAHDFDFSGRRVRQSIEESLQRLQTDYMDLFQAHDIEFGDYRQIVDELLPAMIDLKQQGKTRFIGITSYQLVMMARIAESYPVDTVLSYCRSNLLVDDLDSLLLPAVEPLGLGLINASPLHMGLLTAAGPPSWHPAPAEVKEAAQKIVAFCFDNGLQPEQVALRLCLDHAYIATTLVGMANQDQVEGNLQALSLALDPEVVAQIHKLAVPVKNLVWASGRPGNADYQSEKEVHA